MEVMHDPRTSKFFIIAAGKEAFVTYEKAGNALDLQYSYVPENLAAKGIGDKLVFAVFKYASEKNIKIIPTCELAREFLKKNKGMKKFVKR